MSKKPKLAEPATTDQIEQRTNWDLCVICQTSTNQDKLRIPSTVGYDTLAKNLQSFDELNCLPFNIDISRLSDGGNIKETLVSHNAKWHKACYDRCNSSHIERARKKRLNDSSSFEVVESSSEVVKGLPSPTKHNLRGASSLFSVQTEKEQAPCFFCDDATGYLSRAETEVIDQRVRALATELKDSKLLTKLAAGDMVAIDARYHPQCLASFYNKGRCNKSSNDDEEYPSSDLESQAFAEVVSFIEESDKSVFPLSDLKNLYSDTLKNAGIDPPAYIHSSRFTKRIIHFLPYLEAHTNKHGTILSSAKETRQALLDACKTSTDDVAVMLMRVSNIIRKEIFQQKYTFNGSLDDGQYDKLPKTLESLMNLILKGSCTSKSSAINAVASTMTQMIVFNAVKRGRFDTVSLRHNQERETALPLYIGLLIHNKTRKRELIDTLFDEGICVSYDRVKQVGIDLANTEISRYHQEDIVCPSKMRRGLFTTFGLDNIDKNLSSITSQESLHGTALSSTQHVSTDNEGVILSVRGPIESTGSHMKKLPASYTDVPPTAMVKDQIPPDTRCPDQLVNELLPNSDNFFNQQIWLENLNTQLKSQIENDPKDISWSAFFASLQGSIPKPPAIISLLPLFRDCAHTPAMVKHGMSIIKQTTAHVNPGQTPVMTVDQPLFALAKRIQWEWSDDYGADKFVVLMGGLHIEMAVLKVLGDWLEGSGWTYVVSSVFTKDRADGILNGSHVSRGHWAHQVTSGALYILMCSAYNDYKNITSEDECLTFENWTSMMEAEHPQFSYWYRTLQLELLYLNFIRSQREQKYTNYVTSLISIIPWMFAFDHFHYSRWMSVHVSDLLLLETNNKSVHDEFMKGNFATQKTERKFSGMAHDQIHEQLNAVVKGDGGIVGITENDDALRRWMVAGPETARMLSEYNDKNNKSQAPKGHHHEQVPHVQNEFMKNVKSIVKSFEEAGNPFADTSQDLYTLDSKVIMPESVKIMVKSAEKIGKAQFQNFVSQRIHGDRTTFNDAIKKNNFATFSSYSEKKMSKPSAKINNLHRDVSLFSRLYIASQTRDSDMDDFFAHENHPWPPSLASNGIMHSSNKSDLMDCLESMSPTVDSEPTVDVIVIDGAALLHNFDPNKSQTNAPVNTFADYSEQVFIPYIEKRLRNVYRIDIIWDVYIENSLKSETRKNRGCGTPIRVELDTIIPTSWKDFLRNDTNKDSLSKLLAKAVECHQFPPSKVVVSTLKDKAVSSPIIDLSQLSCSHEEADTRLLFHVKHLFDKGFRTFMIQATDTDVVVISVAMCSILSDCEIWVVFGHGKGLRYVPCHTFNSILGTKASWGLLFFHAFTGCDTVSSFYGIGKKTAWNVLKTMPDMFTLFAKLSTTPDTISSDQMQELERYVVLLYQRTSTLSSVNSARKHMFTQNRKMDNIPPSYAALEQHVRRAAYQAGHIWGQSLVADPVVPPPEQWGWKRVDDSSSSSNSENQALSPCWTILPEAASACLELIKCRCKVGCTGRCSCVKANLQCTDLCLCMGQCLRE